MLYSHLDNNGDDDDDDEISISIYISLNIIKIIKNIKRRGRHVYK